MDIDTTCGIIYLEQMFLEIERKLAVIAYRIAMMEANLVESDSAGDQLTTEDREDEIRSYDLYSRF